jgi:hypothetical protein
MDVTIYMPDELGTRAKAAGVNFSGVTREAVTRELERREELASLTRGRVKHEELELEDKNGERVLLRFDGTLLAGDVDANVYLLAEDGGVLVVLEEDYVHLDSAEEFIAWQRDLARDNQGRSIEEVLEEAARELGAPRVVEF